VSGVVGLVAVVPFVVGQGQLDVGSGNLGVQINRWMEVLGSAVVIALVLVPAVDDWVTRRPQQDVPTRVGSIRVRDTTSAKRA
jgi:hypothetical protein